MKWHDIYGTSFVREWDDVNNFMDLERALHKKCDQIPMGLISSMMRLCVGACGF